MEVILLAVWKFVIIIAAAVFVLVLSYKIISWMSKFLSHKLSPRKRNTRPTPRTQESGYRTPAIEKI